MRLDREILRSKLRTLRTETMPLPSWGGDVTIRELSAAERFAIPSRSKEVAKRYGLTEGFAMACIIAVMAIMDDDGPIFTADDIPLFGNEELGDLFSVAKRVAEMSALGEGNEGKSQGTPSESSPSA